MNDCAERYAQYILEEAADAASLRAIDGLLTEAFAIYTTQHKAAEESSERHPLWMRQLFALDPQLVVLTLSHGLLLWAFNDNGTKTSFMVHFGEALYNQFVYLSAEPELQARITKRIADKGWNQKRRAAYNKVIQNAQGLKYNKEHWTKISLMIFGWLFGTRKNPTELGKSMVLITQERPFGDEMIPSKVGLSPDLIAEIDRHHPLFEFNLFFRYEVMVCPPIDHQWAEHMTATDNGGYVNTWLRKNTVPGKSRASQRNINIINKIQSTAYELNRPVLDVMTSLFDDSKGQADLPLRTVVPPMATGDKTKDAKAQLVFRKDVQASLAMKRRLAVASKVNVHKNFWVPYTFDFRSRFVASATELTPHGCDFDRGLILFANEVELDDTGRYWLKVNLANTYGVDKVSFDERVQWVDDNWDRFKKVSIDPISRKSVEEWGNADKPWQALATIFELFRTDGMTSMPVYVDGANNGTQHLSLLSNDSSTGYHVNLMECDKPQDYYGIIAQECEAILGEYKDGKLSVTDIVTSINNEKDADKRQQKREHAVRDLDLLAERFVGTDRMSRSILKVPVMCTPYSLTAMGRQENYVNKDPLSVLLVDANIFEEGSQRFTDREWAKIQKDSWFIWAADQTYTKDSDLKFQSVVATFDKVFEKAIHRKSGSADSVMKYLRRCASAMTKCKLDLQWTTPTGFVASQNYITTDSKELCAIDRNKKPEGISTNWACIRVPRLDANGETQIKLSKSVNGASPNVIHSLDSSHLQMTAERMYDKQFTDLVFIHDAFGCHANHVDEMQEALRDTAIEMYQSNYLMDFHKQVSSMLPAGEAPIDFDVKFGDLDVKGLRDAEYFFG